MYTLYNGTSYKKFADDVSHAISTGHRVNMIFWHKHEHHIIGHIYMIMNIGLTVLNIRAKRNIAGWIFISLIWRFYPRKQQKVQLHEIIRRSSHFTHEHCIIGGHTTHMITNSELTGLNIRAKLNITG